jgi:hypothetical protein
LLVAVVLSGGDGQGVNCHGGGIWGNKIFLLPGHFIGEETGSQGNRSMLFFCFFLGGGRTLIGAKAIRQVWNCQIIKAVFFISKNSKAIPAGLYIIAVAYRNKNHEF